MPGLETSTTFAKQTSESDREDGKSGTSGLEGHVDHNIIENLGSGERTRAQRGALKDEGL